MIALSLFMLLVGAVVMAGARDSMQSVDRTAALRAEYNAESAANIALRELVTNVDVDGNITGTLTAANNSGVVRRALLPMIYLPTGWSAGSEGAMGHWGGTMTISGDQRFSSFDTGNNAVINVTAPSRVLVDNSFNMYGSSQLTIAADASLDLYVAGAVTFSTNVMANVSNNPDRFRIHRVGTSNNEVRLTDNSRLHAHVINTFGAMNIWNNDQANCEFIGTIRAQNLDVFNNIRLRIDIGPEPQPWSSSISSSPVITSWIEP